MATRPTLRLLWQRPLGRFALLGLLLAGAAAWYVMARGGWVNALHLPPVLDASTPRSQNGYTLSELQYPEEKTPAAVYLLIKPPEFPKCFLYAEWRDGTHEYRPVRGSLGPIVQATGQTPQGDVTSLPWTLRGDETKPQYIRVEIPGGYASDSRFIDVTLVTNDGPFPRWRITRLPKMRRVIPDTPMITDSVTENGITTTALAWRFRHQIYFQTRPILPVDSHQWEMTTNDQWSQWEKFDQPHGQELDIRQPIIGRRGAFAPQDIRLYGSLTTNLPADYRSASRYVRTNCTLRQFETYDERLTFHNLPVKEDPQGFKDENYETYGITLMHSLTLTTPSGIRVTLPTQDEDFKAPMGDKINLKLSAQQTAGPRDLPNSPLVRQFGKPVSISIQFAPPYAGGGWTIEPGETHTYGLRRPQNPAWRFSQPRGARHIPLYLGVPPALKDLTVIVHQRVDIQTIPMTFTVPVSDTPPPDVH